MLSTRRKRGNDGSSGFEEIEKKKRKGFGYSLPLKIWILKHFTYKEGYFIPADQIVQKYRVDSSEKENPEISRKSIGKIIMDLWARQGVRKKKVGKRGEKCVMGYYNLGVTVNPTNDKVNEYSLDYIEKELQIRNWATVRNNDNSLSFIRSEERAFNGQSCSTEILVTLLNDKEKCYELKVMSHGFSLSVEELGLDKELKSGDVMEQIKVIARFLDSSRMCCGFPVEKEHVSKHQLSTNIVVAVSYIGQPSRPIENRMFSGRCKIIAPANQCCTSCSSAKRDETRRRNRQNSVGKGKSNPRANYRYLSEVGIAKKLAEQKQQLKNARAREERWKKKFEEQLIQLEESDHNDLQCIILDDTCNQNVPPEMSKGV